MRCETDLNFLCIQKYQALGRPGLSFFHLVSKLTANYGGLYIREEINFKAFFSRFPTPLEKGTPQRLFAGHDETDVSSLCE